METTQWYKSKRFWSGVISMITGVSLIITGEKTFEQVLPEMLMTVIGLIQMFIGLSSGKPVDFGSRSLYKK